MVVANRLDTRKTSVSLVTMDSEEKVQLTQDEVAKELRLRKGL